MMTPDGFGRPSYKLKSVIERIANRDGDLSDQELRERASAMMKQAPLFHRMSWRFLGDLVVVEGLRVANDASNPTVLNFSVLVVLEGTLIVRTTAPTMPPLDKVVELSPGVYLKTDPALDGPQSAIRTIYTPASQEFRYYALTPDTIRNLPAQALMGMDAATLPSHELGSLL